ncbi:head-tail connector protein [Sphingomonas sp. MMS24-JH45]
MRAITAVVAAGRPAVGLAATAFAVDINAEARGWVRAAGMAGPIAVTFVAGEATGWAGLPQALRQGVVLLAAHLFADREGARTPPAAVTALWRPYRAIRLAEAMRHEGGGQ